MNDAWIEEVNRFWFDELAPKDWFRVREAVDETIRQRFGALRETLAREPLAIDGLDGNGHVAAVIVFDQFPRNLFRGDADAFATDGRALAIARHAIERGLDRGLTESRRHFLYMPFMHSEDRAAQDESMALFERLGVAGALEAAIEHRETIARFGRFPARNAALGRESTPKEMHFLASKNPPKGNG